MPFTLAHPAAVLPLKRYCPRFLGFAGLVMGSVAPDAGYLFKLENFSHSFVGSFAFSLPVAIVMLALFYGLRRRIVELLPDAQRRIFLPPCKQPVPSLFVMVISILIGAWTHLLWDSFTHRKGWLVVRLPFLQIQTVQWAHHRLLLCDVLTYACSFAGVALLYFAYAQWREQADPALPRVSFQTGLRNALFVGLLVLPIEALHHLIRSAAGYALVGLCSMAMVIGIVLGIGNPFSVRPRKEP
jgi:hypothetical protein